jgi:hypothetical protein
MENDTSKIEAKQMGFQQEQNRNNTENNPMISLVMGNT